MSKKQSDSYEGCLGYMAKVSEIKKWALRLCNDNFKRFQNDEPRWTGNVWGLPGTAKTEVLKQFKDVEIKYKGEQKKFQIVDVPVAQIEEMGDILGVPEEFILVTKQENGSVLEKWIHSKDVIIDYYLQRGWGFENGGGRVETQYAPPEWVPVNEGPGIIIFDDGNRASERILKGMMQLVQDYKTIGWSIPEGWTIVFTGNPDNNQFLVATQDSAMKTRNRHVTMKVDASEWAVWAEKNSIDPRGINFVLTYKEIVEQQTADQRTNLRTLTEFFRCLKNYDNNDLGGTTKKISNELLVDAYSLLDEETVTQFVTYITRDMNLVIEPEEILNNVEKFYSKIDKFMPDNGQQRIDIISVICDRIYAYVVQGEYKVSNTHVENLQKFILYDKVPHDLSYSLLSRIADAGESKPELFKFLEGNVKLREMLASGLRVISGAM